VTEEQLEFAKIGFVFSAALTILCWPVAAAPQRGEIFAALGIYPLGFGFLIWPAVGYLLAGARSDFGASACLVAVTFYNYWVARGSLPPPKGRLPSWSGCGAPTGTRAPAPARPPHTVPTRRYLAPSRG
jgi:hypothetical protein